jgi:hypothetical protein
VDIAKCRKASIFLTPTCKLACREGAGSASDGLAKRHTEYFFRGCHENAVDRGWGTGRPSVEPSKPVSKSARVGENNVHRGGEVLAFGKARPSGSVLNLPTEEQCIRMLREHGEREIVEPSGGGQDERAREVGRMTSRWCGALFTGAWPAGTKRKREQKGPGEEAKTGVAEELPELLRWMETLEAGGPDNPVGARAFRGQDHVLELLEEMLGFRRRGDDAESVERKKVSSGDGVITQGIAGLRGQDMVGLCTTGEPIRTVPLGRGWEEECIRGVLEVIVRQGAAQKSDMQAGQQAKRAKNKGSTPLGALLSSIDAASN